MKFKIDSSVIEKDNITMQEFSVLLYYMSEGKGVLNNELCDSLWNKGFLIKTDDGFAIDNNKIGIIENWMVSSVEDSKEKQIKKLAENLRKLYPEGKKEGTNFYWRDSTPIIMKRLLMFYKKFGEDYTPEDIMEATKKYVQSFNGSYQYMQLLKYFIYKRNNEEGEYTSQLLSYLENSDQQDMNDWTINMI